MYWVTHFFIFRENLPKYQIIKNIFTNMAPLFQMLPTSCSFLAIKNVRKNAKKFAKYICAPPRLHGSSHFPIIDTQVREGKMAFSRNSWLRLVPLTLENVGRKHVRTAAGVATGHLALFFQTASVARLVTCQYVSCLYWFSTRTYINI